MSLIPDRQRGLLRRVRDTAEFCHAGWHGGARASTSAGVAPPTASTGGIRHESGSGERHPFRSGSRLVSMAEQFGRCPQDGEEGGQSLPGPFGSRRQGMRKRALSELGGASRPGVQNQEVTYEWPRSTASHLH